MSMNEVPVGVARSPTPLAMIALIAVFGIAGGLGIFTFNFAEGWSYFSNDPAACVNCHAMNEQFNSWNHSSHKSVAGCNDCHTPHTFPDKWIVKGINGWNHSLAFTTGNYPDPIQIRGFNERIAHANCVGCHSNLLDQVEHTDAHTNLIETFFVSEKDPQALDCVSCHGNVGHGNAAQSE